ncbi:MAG: hypothetical protein WCF18_19730 [Chthoniobacteraceae bacterium]
MNFVAALLYAVATSVLLATALAFARGGLDLTSAWISLTMGALLGAWSAWKQRHGTTRHVPPNGWEWLAIVLFALASARAFLWLVFADGDKIKILSPNNLGDLSLHLTYIRFLANGAAFWPDNPIFTHGKLTYPVGIDLFNALLTLTGVDPLRGLIWAGLAGAALAGAALWRWGRGIALAAFLGNGGLAGFAVFAGGHVADFQTQLAWKSIFLALFVTQRGLLFALPAGLLLLASWRSRFFRDDGWRLPRAGELLLYASMPLFHLHTFIFLSLMLASWFVLHPPSRRGLGILVGSAFVPASALVLLVTGTLGGASVLGFKPGWMWDDATWLQWCEEHLPGSPTLNAMLLFWPINFGFLLPLVGWLGFRLWKDPRAGWPRALFFPALFIFLLCVFVKFAPWEWDNTKLMIWSYLAIVPLAWNELLAARPLWQRALAAVALFGSGFVSLLGGLDGTHTGFDIATRSELDAVEKAIAAIPITERFVGYPTYNHPLLLAGRKLALGYTGHAWSHGLDWARPAARVDALLNGDPDWHEAAVELDVRYLFWGAEEKEHYPGSTQPWKLSARLAAQGEWGEIYDLTAPKQ